MLARCCIVSRPLLMLDPTWGGASGRYSSASPLPASYRPSPPSSCWLGSPPCCCCCGCCPSSCRRLSCCSEPSGPRVTSWGSGVGINHITVTSVASIGDRHSPKSKMHDECCVRSRGRSHGSKETHGGGVQRGTHAGSEGASSRQARKGRQKP